MFINIVRKTCEFLVHIWENAIRNCKRYVYFKVAFEIVYIRYCRIMGTAEIIGESVPVNVMILSV